MAGARLVRKLFQTPPLSNLSAGEILPGLANVSDEYDSWATWIKSSFGANSHPLATCAMMRKDLGGVVNGRLKVYGTSNLRIVDASIMPTQISAHLSSTLYGIAEKLADMIMYKV